MLSNKNAAVIFFFALAVRIINLFFLIPEGFDFKLEDQGIYVGLGLSMLETGNFSYNNGDGYTIETERTPLYPFFLAFVWDIAGYNPWAIVFIQSLIDSISCVIIGLISSLFVPKAFLLGGLLSAINMNLVVSSGMILPDSLFVFLFTLFIWFSISYLNSQKIKYLIYLSLALSLSILTRPVAYYLIPILGFIFLWFLFLKGYSLKAIALHILVFFLTTSILLVHLISRNYEKFETISITSQSGVHLSGYLVPLTIHFSEGKPYLEAVDEVKEMIDNYESDRYIDKYESNPFEVSRYKSKISITRLLEIDSTKIAYSWLLGSTLNLISSGVMVMPRIRELPHRSFYKTPGESIVKKVINFISSADSLIYLVVVAIANIVSLFLFLIKLIGCYSLVKNPSQYKGRWVVFFIFGIIAYFLLITGPIIGVKYTLPIESLLTVLLVIGLSRLKLFRRFF